MIMKEQKEVSTMVSQQEAEMQQKTETPQPTEEQPSMEEPTPMCLEHFNAGAFTFTWFWGICNGVWLSLLAFIPVVSIILRFILGFYGNGMAWEKQKNHSVNVEVFDKRQRGWSIAGWIILGAFLTYVIVALIVIGVLNS